MTTSCPSNTLNGDGVVLRPLSAADADELFPLLSDPAVYEFLDEAIPSSREAFINRLTRLERQRSPDGSEAWLNWTVRTEPGHAVGYVQATIYPHGEASIAFVIGRPHWGQGLGYAATRTMIRELVASHGVTALRATADPANERSIMLLGKLGFEPIGPARLGADVEFIRRF